MKILWQILQNTRQKMQIKTLETPKTPKGSYGYNRYTIDFKVIQPDNFEMKS